jgi:hypothetical protein
MKAAIAPPQYKSQTFYKDGNTQDIIETILKVVKNYNIAAETKEFSKGFKATIKDMERLYWLVKDNIRYTEDPQGFQWIRTPARTWSDRNKGADCKSFTVFLVSIFQNLGLDYTIRFASYNPNKVIGHVYPLVKIGGKWIVMDAVWDYFNDEKDYTFKKDFKMSEIAVLSGVNRRNNIGMVLTRDIDNSLDEITQNLVIETKSITDNIPDFILMADGGDITQMTGGEFSRWLAAKQHPNFAAEIRQGLIMPSTPQSLVQFIYDTAGNNAPAFEIPFDVAELNRQTAQIGSIFSKVGDWFKSQWQKLMNWIFKDGLKKGAEFFLYIFSSPITNLIGMKKAKQLKVIEWMAKASGQSVDKYTQTLRAHIMEKNGGKTPETLLNEAAQSGTSKNQGWVSAVLAALPAVIEVIKKIAGLFKKNDAPSVEMGDGSDPSEYGSEWQNSLPPVDSTETGTDG